MSNEIELFPTGGKTPVQCHIKMSQNPFRIASCRSKRSGST